MSKPARPRIAILGGGPVGIESALMVRPYLERMTRSEFLMLLTTGMCNVASSTLGLYVAFLKGVFPLIAGHLLSASILSIPAGVVMAKMLVPETQEPETLAHVPPDDAAIRAKNVTADEVRGFARTMRRLARRPILPEGTPLVDMVGTGGDGLFYCFALPAE